MSKKPCIVHVTLSELPFELMVIEEIESLKKEVQKLRDEAQQKKISAAEKHENYLTFFYKGMVRGLDNVLSIITKKQVKFETISKEKIIAEMNSIYSFLKNYESDKIKISKYDSFRQ